MVYGLVRALLTPILRAAFRIKVEGADQIPPAGPVILASNHQAFCDSLFIPLVAGRRVTFVAKAEYFDSWKTGWLFRMLGQIPMDRSGGSGTRRSLDEASSTLAAGGCLGIYPEGTRSPDERLHRGRTGVARLALKAQCPVVPVGVAGTRAVQPIGARMLRPFKRVEISFGAPLDLFGRYGEALDDPMTLRRATDDVMWEIGLLSGQAYVDRYASRKPAGSGEGAALPKPVEPVAVVGVGSGG